MTRLEPPGTEGALSPDADGRGGDFSFRTLLRGNVGALASSSFLNDASSEMVYPLLPVFLTGVLGAGAGFLGIVEGVADSSASFMKLAGGWISDRLRRRKALVGWGYGTASLARPLLALAMAPWHVLGIRFVDRIGKGVRTAPRDALLADSVTSDRRGTAFGLHRAADHAGAVVGPLLATGILFFFPEHLRLVFAVAAVPGLAAVATVLVGVREVAPPASARAEASVTLRDLGPVFPRYLSVLLLFTLGNASDAFLLLRAGDLGVAMTLVPLVWGVLHVSKMAWSVPGGMLADRFPPRDVILSGWVVYALVYAGFAAATSTWHVWALFVAYGLFYGLTESPEKALVAALAPGEMRARAFGAYHFAIGVGALPASLLFGFLWQVFGAPVAFLTSGGLALLAALLLPPALRR